MPSLMEYNIGYNPDTIQAKWGQPQTSAYGNAVRGGFNPLGGANWEWFVFEPDFPYMNNMGYQMVSISQAEFLYGSYYGYRGILPLGLQAVSPEPYPYQIDYPYNQSA